MDPPQAKAFARAFQLGMTRALQHCVTRADIALFATKEELWMVRDDIRREMDQLRREMRFYMLLNAGLLGAILAVVLTRL